MAKIIYFQEYIDARKKEKLCREKITVLPKEGMKTGEAEGKTAETGRRNPYIIVIY